MDDIELVVVKQENFRLKEEIEKMRERLEYLEICLEAVELEKNKLKKFYETEKG